MDKTGFVSVIGRPNVGKSTLLNRLIGEKISIISNKPQTTRENIKMIYSDDNSQIIFVDTPGVQTPKNILGKAMEKSSKSSVSDMDLVLYLVDTSNYIGDSENRIIEFLKTVDLPIILVINKIDMIDKEELFALISMYNELDMFDEIVPISSINGENVDVLMEVIKEKLPEGPRYYPDDQITDKTERFIIEEIIREKALKYLREEVPHGIYVEVESMKEETSPIEISAVIYAEKDSHKGIILGKGGSMIKKIRVSSQDDIETFLGEKVNLKLWVKVEKNWREKENIVKRFGY